MSHYIKPMVEVLIEKVENAATGEGLASRFQALNDELAKLDPLDFSPKHRYEFVETRRRLSNYSRIKEQIWRWIYDGSVTTDGVSFLEFLYEVELREENRMWASHPGNTVFPIMLRSFKDATVRLLSQASTTLDSYLGADALAKTREFAYVRDVDLRGIVERDYHELVIKLFPTGSWKSVVILAGSILEALLGDLLTRDPVRVSSAESASSAPKKKGGGPRDITSDAREDEWMLFDLIQVADELKLLPAGWKEGLHVNLRDPRNYVHPRKEKKQTDKLTQGEAFVSVGSLMKICDHLEKHHP